MENRIFKTISLGVMAFVVIFISSSRKTKAADKTTYITELAEVRNIHKISVMGNVELILSQGIQENLKVYDQYYSKNALVQWSDGELRISSFENEKLKVHITVTNLSSVEASGGSSVSSTNKISSIDLDIRLKDNATANLQAQAINLSSTVADQSKLELSGESINQHIGLSGSAEYAASKFDTQNKTMMIGNDSVVTINQEGAATSIKTVTRTSKKEEALAFEPIL